MSDVIRKVRLAVTTATALAGLALLAAAGLGAPGQGPAKPEPGVFRYSMDTDPDELDPALANYAPAWEILYATCSMLVNYPDAPAPRGSRLVLDGAAAMPTVSPDGKTYTFRVRTDRRFSDGSAITARSFERALVRVLHRTMRSPAQPYFRDIVGAERFSEGRAKRVQGIAVLPGNRLRIRLTARAPDLLARLAMPFACAVKENLSTDPFVRPRTFAGSGPYYVADREWGRRLVLRRNPFYRGPRPQNVSAARYDIGLPLGTIRLKIEANETDHGGVPAAAHAELGRRYGALRRSPGQYFVNPSSTIRYLVFNHERELFGKPGGGPGAGLGNVALKRAVNFAIDRTAMLNQRGAYAGIFTDQYLPPSAPGMRNEAIYPVTPDVARARALARGNTRRGTGTFDVCNTGPCIPIAQIVQDNLRTIGLDLDIRVYPRCSGCGPKPWIRGQSYDLLLETWRSPYFDPHGFLFVFDGRTIGPEDNTNYAYFDSDEYIRKLVKAASLAGERRYRALGALDVDLARKAAPWASYAVDNDRRFFSARVQGFFSHPVYGLDLPALKVG